MQRKLVSDKVGAMSISSKLNSMSKSEVVKYLNTNGVSICYDSVAIVCESTGDVLAIELGEDRVLAEATINSDGSFNFAPFEDYDSVGPH